MRLFLALFLGLLRATVHPALADDAKATPSTLDMSTNSVTALVVDPSTATAKETRSCGTFSFEVNYATKNIDRDGNVTGWYVYTGNGLLDGPDRMETMLRAYEPYFLACLSEEKSGMDLMRLDYEVRFNGYGKIWRVTKATLPFGERPASACMLRVMRHNMPWMRETNRVNFTFIRTECPDK